jgi:hypothetical protein
LENLNDSKNINKTSENNDDDIKTSAKESPVLYELKQQKPWSDKECSRFLHQEEAD